MKTRWVITSVIVREEKQKATPFAFCSLNIPGWHYSGFPWGGDCGFGFDSSDFFDELGFEPHRANAVDLAIDVMVAIHQTNVFDFGANLDNKGRTLHFQIFDHRHGVAILQDIAIGILDDEAVMDCSGFLGGPFVPTLRAHKMPLIHVGELGPALGTIGQVTHKKTSRNRMEVSMVTADALFSKLREFSHNTAL